MNTDALLRWSIAAVFLWFGIAQLSDPSTFLSYAPAWIGLEPSTLVLLNGALDTSLGTLLLIGVYPSLVGGVAVVHMLGIVVSLGYNQVTVRDAGLMLATVVITLNGADEYCVTEAVPWSTS